MLNFILFFFLFVVFFYWVFYSGSPFVSVVFVTSLSAILGFFLLSIDLGFAGMVLIIVNAGAIAVVFLFVCILAKRETVVTRFVPLFFFPCMAVFFFAMTNLSTRLLGFLFSCVLDEHYTNPVFFSPVKESLRLSDVSVSSHLVLTIFSPQWWPVLGLVGLFLFLVMVVAINVTKTWVFDRANSSKNNLSLPPRLPVGYYNRKKFLFWFKKNKV